MTGAPKLTNILLKYSSWWYLMGIPAVILLVIGNRFVAGSAKKETTGMGKPVWGKMILIGIVTSGCMILWYTMQDAGCWDYKNGLLPGMLWLVGMILGVGSLSQTKGAE